MNKSSSSNDRVLRAAAVADAATYLALLLVAVPLKRLFDLPQFVPPMGMLHGLCFLLYVWALFDTLVLDEARDLAWLLRSVFLALIPAGALLALRRR